jgi:hypothetical protein
LRDVLLAAQISHFLADASWPLPAPTEQWEAAAGPHRGKPNTDVDSHKVADQRKLPIIGEEEKKTSNV